MTSMLPPVVHGLRAEYRSDTRFVATPDPRLSWRTETSAPDWTQVSAEIESDGASAVVDGRDSVFVDWPFSSLAPGDERTVRVRVTGSDGSVSEWSEPLSVAAGFLGDGEWVAPLVRAAGPVGVGQPVLVRGTFEIPENVTRAILFATAQGCYQVEVNGEEVDDEILKPGWTAYQHRLTHETTDVTRLLQSGTNAIGVHLAGGWFTESYGFHGNDRPFYGTRPAVSVQLSLTLADGSTRTITSDESWVTHSGPVRSSGIYAGEDYDARAEEPGFSTADFDASAWAPVETVTNFPVPSPRSGPAVRVTDEIAVKDVITSPSGRTLLDFGQNLVGRLRITVAGARGHTVTLRHAEVLEHGELGVRPLRRAKATDRYTLAGGGEAETWEPRFTFHGFRYAEIDNWPGTFDPADVTAVVFHSDMERTGWFDSSHDLVNKLHDNVVWGMRGNFLYVPTDCPQRDERLGWTGDIQVFSPTASYLYDSAGFLDSWLQDLALEQKERDGVVPFIVPDVLGSFAAPAAAWGDAATVVPSVLHERFGDSGVIARQYESMRDWADTLLRLSGDRLLWEGGFQFGDWLDPDASPDFPADAKTDADIVASAHLFLSVDLVAKAAVMLGHHEDAARYGDLAVRIRDAYRREYVTGAGRMVSDAQTAYAMTIMFGIAEGVERQRMGDRLAHLVRADGYRIATGFVGTPLVTDALTLTGHLDVAGRLLTQTESPSWLYSVTMGATTIWERWDSMLPDGSINPGEMTSFNHYALGSVADWLHRSLGGLAPAEPGYRTIRIAPRPIAEIDRASTSHLTPYGLASVTWERTGDTVVVNAVVPPNTSAEVSLPGTDERFVVGSGEHRWTATVVFPQVDRPEHSLQSELTAIIDDPEAYQALLDEIESIDPDAARVLTHHTKWLPGRTLSEELMMMNGAISEAADVALQRVNASRS